MTCRLVELIAHGGVPAAGRLVGDDELLERSDELGARVPSPTGARNQRLMSEGARHVREAWAWPVRSSSYGRVLSWPAPLALPPCAGGREQWPIGRDVVLGLGFGDGDGDGDGVGVAIHLS